MTLPRATLMEAVEDPKLLGTFALWPRQREMLAAVEAHARSVWCCGRRSSKSTMSALVLLWMALLQPDLRNAVLPGERIQFIAVAANKDQAKIVLNAAKRIVKASPLLAPLIERDDAESIDFTNGSTIAAFVCSSRTTRGWPIAALVLDEFAFFQTSEEGPQAATNVYRALSPSLLQFGAARRLILSSTPNGPGTFKEHFDRAQEVGDAAVFRLPTWEVNPTLDRSLYDEERALLGEQFDAEYGAQFLASGGALLSESDIRSCVVAGGDLEPAEVAGAVCGLDVGWRRDRSAALVLGRNREEPERLRVAAIRTWEPAADAALGVERHAEAVLAEVAELAGGYGATIYADTYESATTKARLRKHGASVETIPTGAGVKGTMYRDLAAKIRLGQVAYPDHPLLIGELRRLRVNYQGATPTVENPRTGGGHGDVAAALAMATYHLRVNHEGQLLVSKGRIPGWKPGAGGFGRGGGNGLTPGGNPMPNFGGGRFGNGF